MYDKAHCENDCRRVAEGGGLCVKSEFIQTRIYKGQPGNELAFFVSMTELARYLTFNQDYGGSSPSGHTIMSTIMNKTLWFVHYEILFAVWAKLPK